MCLNSGINISYFGMKMYQNCRYFYQLAEMYYVFNKSWIIFDENTVPSLKGTCDQVPSYTKQEYMFRNILISQCDLCLFILTETIASNMISAVVFCHCYVIRTYSVFFYPDVFHYFCFLSQFIVLEVFYYLLSIIT